MRKPAFHSILIIAVLAASCAPPVYYVRPREWLSPDLTKSVIASFQPYLQGRRIFLDPGHGGEDRVNRGPEGEAIEADVNLRVGLALRDYLQSAGAVVFMSRTKDTTVALRERPKLAEQLGAEIFVSLHHNATGTGDQITNYTTVYYHAYEGHPEYHPANQDIARYIQRDISYAMRNPGPPFFSFDGTLTDFGIYPNSGFAVLRHNSLPAVLIEGSFFTHPYEEQRLAIDEFNRIEAWGIFVGLGRYFRAGIPRLELRSDTIVAVPRPAIILAVAPHDTIDEKTIAVTLNGEPTDVRYDATEKVVAVAPRGDLPSGSYQLDVRLRNTNGISAWPFKPQLTVALPVDTLAVETYPRELPPHSSVQARVVIKAFDRFRAPVVDGTILRISWLGKDTSLVTHNGRARLYVGGLGDAQEGTIIATADSVSAREAIVPSSPHATYFSGIVSSASDQHPIADVAVSSSQHDQPLDVTNDDGRYIVLTLADNPTPFRFYRQGYFAEYDTVAPTPAPTGRDISLTPVARGRLFGKTFMIDPRYGGSEKGDVGTDGSSAADVNLEIGRRLFSLLKASGANAVLTRDRDTAISETDRARRSAEYGRGMYIRIDAAGAVGEARCRIYSSLANRAFAARLLSGIRMVAGLDSADITPSSERFYYDVAMGTISVIVPSVLTGYYSGAEGRYRMNNIAWGLYLGILTAEGYAPDYGVADTMQVGTPWAEVTVHDALKTVSNVRGTARFFGLAERKNVVSVGESVRRSR